MPRSDSNSPAPSANGPMPSPALPSAAVISSSVHHLDALVAALPRSALPASPDSRPSSLSDFTQPFLTLPLALHRRDLAAQLLEPIVTPESGAFTAAQVAAFSHFLDLLSRRGESIAKLAEPPDDALSQQLRHAGELFAAARQSAFDPQLP